MKATIHEIGQSRSHVVVIDDFLDNARAVVDAAAALTPFPPETGTAYPGLRRQIGPADAISAYVVQALRAASPHIGEGFGAPGFAVTEASFSIVTTRPEALRGVQRVPHIDSDDQSLLAILHHLHDIPDTGTAFYRHIATGMERADPQSSGTLRQHLHAEAARIENASTGFAGESNDAFEKIFAVEGRFNRLVIYQGCLLHSGIISSDFSYSADPKKGRLTANMFVRMTGQP
ncbi:MAG: DUF6445 family protein [Asticcacaulis sp.]